jgi:dTDP-glucose 4,6-dehydratase
VGGENECANIEVVRLVCGLIEQEFDRDPALTGRFPRCPASKGRQVDELITPVRDRPGHDRRYAIDPAKIRRELDFHPSETFASGLARTVRWYLEHESWWRGVMDGSYRHWIDTHYGSAAAGSER